MIEKIETWFRKLRRRVSRSELSLKLFRLPSEQGKEAEPGLLMIQIDGLARSQLERALAHHQMPFLQTLLRRERYNLSTLYSGMPSSTPAVQGEIFYGVRTAVPAFSFYDREKREVRRMFGQEAAIRVEEELIQNGGQPLLEGGSAYSDIYTGGAAESHFCAPDLGWGRSKTPPSRWRFLTVLSLNAFSLLRLIALVVVEFFLAWFDFFRGLAEGQSLLKELKFVPTRAAISIGLREFIVAGASMDLARGLPVVHLNFIGYDEQAHRRGPSSAFAHWTLLGIDDAIKRLYSAALRSPNRDYSVWIYSDHGQEETVPFEREVGRSLREVIEEAFELSEQDVALGQTERRGIQFERVPWAGVRRVPREARGQAVVTPPAGERLVITSMGPVGHVYDLAEANPADRRRLAEEMVARGVPLVLFRDPDGAVRAVNSDGSFQLPRDGAALLEPDHPMVDPVVEDLVKLVNHRHAGEYVLAGWRRGARCVSFPDENGSHGGPGAQEVAGFLLLPPGTPIRSPNPSWYRPVNLREAALHHLKRERLPVETGRPRGTPETMRVMTYNVHRCLGVDSKLSPERIARVIAQHQPDVVALQEIDVGRARSGWVDQAQVIADLLLMKFHFYPAFEIEDEKYGLAVLSHYPMRLIKTGALPGLPNKPHIEPRGAQWVGIDYHGREIQFVNTHLGLRGEEKRQQVRAILGESWLGHLSRDEPLIICGDMNSIPSSFVHRQISTRFFDVQSIIAEHKPLRTFYGRYPLSRIDHIFVSSHFEAQRVDVSRTSLTRVASDHLPLFTQLKLKPKR